MFGAIKSPVDKRDFKISRAISKKTLPKRYIIDTHLRPMNQDTVNSCVPHSIEFQRAYTETKQSGKERRFSIIDIYANRKEGQWQGEGMCPREAYKNLLADGVLDYDYLPGNEEMPEAVNIRNSKAAYAPRAYKNRISAFYLLESVEDIETAVSEDNIVSLMIYVGPKFINLGKDGRITWKTEFVGGGYHQVSIYGYDHDLQEFYCANSWGKDWGNNGDFILPYAYRREEAWAEIDNIIPSYEDTATTLEFTIGKASYLFDGREKSLDAPATIINNTTLVPVRVFAQSLGFSVYWENSTQTVTLKRKKAEVIFSIGNNTVKVINNGRETSITLSVPAMLINNRTMLPIRFIAEIMGCTVYWYEEEQKVVVKR